MDHSIETWLHNRGANEPAFQSLLRRKRNLNVVNFAAVVRSLEEISVDEKTLEQLQLSYQTARSLSPNCLAMAFAHPTMVYWNKTTERLLPFILNRQPIPDFMMEHLAGIQAPNVEPVRLHLVDLNRFLITAALLANAEVTLPCPIHDGWLTLPGLGVRIACPEGGIVRVSVHNSPSRAICCGQNSRVELESVLDRSLNGDDEAISNGTLQALRLVRGSAGAMFLDPCDPYFSRVWQKQTFPGGIHVRQVEGEDLGRWQSTLTESLNLLQELWPEMESEITTAVHTLVPVNSPIGGMNCSCSSEDFWGAILCSFDPPPLLAEVLVHEFGHNLLYGLMEVYGIFAEDCPKEQVFYSPWRPDARPLVGVLHAVYKFERVAEFYRRLLQKDSSNVAYRERYSLILGRLERGLRVLAESAKFNAEGTVFFESLVRGVKKQRESGEAIIAPNIQESLEEHLRVWKTKYPNLRASDFGGLANR